MKFKVRASSLARGVAVGIANPRCYDALVGPLPLGLRLVAAPTVCIFAMNLPAIRRSMCVFGLCLVIAGSAVGKPENITPG